MCQCCCADFSATHKLPAPGGGFYSVQIYFGCGSCHTPAGIMIGRHSAEDDSWRVSKLPDLTFPTIQGEDYEGQQSLIPIFNPEVLAEAIRKKLEPLEERLYRARMHRIADEFIPTNGGWEELIREHQDRVRDQAKKGGMA